MNEARLDPQLRPLLATFLPEAWGILAGLEEALRGLGRGEDEAARSWLAVLLHRLEGSAALYRLDELAVGANRLALLVAAADGGDAEAREAARAGLTTGLGELAAELLAAERQGTPPPADDPIAVELLAFRDAEAAALGYFVPELRDLVDQAHDAVLQAADGRDEGLRILRRVLHTIKGSAFVTGCAPVGEFTHRLESALAGLGSPAGLAGANAAPVLTALDVLGRMLAVVDGAAAPQGSLAAAREAALAGLSGLAAASREEGVPAAGDAGTAGPLPAVAPPSGDAFARLAAPAPAAASRPQPVNPLGLRLPLGAIDQLVGTLGDLLAVRNRLGREVSLVQRRQRETRAVLDRLAKVLAEFGARHQDPLPVAPAGVGGAGSPLSLLTDLELDRYDDFNLLARRVDEIGADLRELRAEESSGLTEIAWSAEDLARQLDELRRGLSRLRLVPVGQLLARAARAARRAASTARREVAVELTGEGVEVDATVAERLWEPLVHLVGNAAVHGFEEAAERVAAGKPAVGRLRLAARTLGRSVVVEVTDDGRGVDARAVATRARALGIDVPGGAPPAGDALLALLTRPGFSTAAAATEASGRGVGLDVVRSTVEDLGGSLALETAVGTGTTFRVVVPVSLVVDDVLLVAVGSQTLAIPGEVERVLDGAGVPADATTVEYDGEQVPLVDLAAVLCLPAGVSATPRPVVVAAHGGRRRALRVDAVVGAETVVVRRLNGLLEGVAPVAGGFVSGEGRLVLVLQLAGLSAAALPAGEPDRRELEPVPGAAPVRPRVLLVDDSVSVRKTFAAFLERGGYEVSLAADGEEAVDRLAAGGCDLLVTDLEMPRRNGLELISWARRRPETAELPIVVVTTRVGEKHRALVLRLGVAEFLPKPVDEGALLAAAGRALRRS